MIKKITIKNIKHIQFLEFDIPKKAGVYILTGGNGSGKTTLMTCLLRIGWYRSFQDYFKTGNERVDSYEGEVVYTLGDEDVTYHYAGSRWPPKPRKNSELLKGFGFPKVRFLPATGNRLYIHDQNINPTDFRAVAPDLKNDLNELLDTDKFNNLRYIQTGSSRGPGGGSERWKRAYVIKKGNSYYSEKNFSLGEILILNTLLLIRDVPVGSLLLIDELEMALHPRVQIRLLRYLEKKSIEKRLTVILSTHSSSIIKCAKKLIYLENTGDGIVKVNTNCYPAVILKDVAIEEDILPDYIFLVEDDMAEMFLKETIQYYSRIEQTRLMPVYKVMPIGGYVNVLEFAEKSANYLFHSKIRMYLFLDADVKESKSIISTKANNRDASEQELFELFTKLDNTTKYIAMTKNWMPNWFLNSITTVAT